MPQLFEFVLFLGAVCAASVLCKRLTRMAKRAQRTALRDCEFVGRTCGCMHAQCDEAVLLLPLSAAGSNY